MVLYIIIRYPSCSTLKYIYVWISHTVFFKRARRCFGGVDAFAYVVKCLAQGKGYIDDGDGEWLMFLCF